MIPPSTSRRYGFPDHRPPTGRHAGGREQAHRWRGTSRIIDRAGHRRNNRRTWAAELANARREAKAR